MLTVLAADRPAGGCEPAAVRPDELRGVHQHDGGDCAARGRVAAQSAVLRAARADRRRHHGHGEDRVRDRQRLDAAPLHYHR